MNTELHVLKDEQQLEQLLSDVAEQNEQWSKAKAALREVDPGTRLVFEELPQANTNPPATLAGIRG